MMRVIDTPNYMTKIVHDEEGIAVLKDGNIVTEQVLMFTLSETFEVDKIESEDGTSETLKSIEKKRIMPNGDVYVIDGNNVLFIPLVPENRIVTEDEKYKDMINQLMATYLSTFPTV